MKQVVASFFGMGAHIATIALEDCHTETVDWYIGIYLSKVFESWCKRRPGAGLRGLHPHDASASAHTAAATSDFWPRMESSWCLIHPVRQTWLRATGSGVHS